MSKETRYKASSSLSKDESTIAQAVLQNWVKAHGRHPINRSERRKVERQARLAIDKFNKHKSSAK